MLFIIIIIRNTEHLLYVETLSLCLDVSSDEVRPTEIAPKSHSLLRPSAFSVPVTTTTTTGICHCMIDSATA